MVYEGELEQVGQYNVDLYSGKNGVLSQDTDEWVAMAIVTKFDSADKEIGHKRFYVSGDVDDDKWNKSFGIVFHSEPLLDAIFEMKDNTLAPLESYRAARI